MWKNRNPRIKYCLVLKKKLTLFFHWSLSGVSNSNKSHQTISLTAVMPRTTHSLTRLPLQDFFKIIFFYSLCHRGSFVYMQNNLFMKAVPTTSGAGKLKLLPYLTSNLPEITNMPLGDALLFWSHSNKLNQFEWSDGWKVINMSNFFDDFNHKLFCHCTANNPSLN